MVNEIDARPWLVEIAVEPRWGADGEKLVAALARLATEDEAFHVAIASETGQFLLKGMDEPHLDAKIDMLRNAHNIDVIIGAPRIAYRETIRRSVEVDYSHKNMTAREFARVILEIEPNETGRGNAFESKVVGGTVPERFIPGVKKGFDTAVSAGVVAGFPVVDVRVVLVDGAYHETDSSPVAFEIAARMAIRQGFEKAGAVLLEPVMKVDVMTPEEYLGGIIGDLNSRRGQIVSTGTQGDMHTVGALVPLAKMFFYAESLRLMSRDHATFTLKFDHYAPVAPPEGDPPFRPAMGMRA